MFAFQCSLFKSLLKTLLYIFFFHCRSQTCLYGDFSESDLEWEPKLLTCSQEVYLIEPLINLFVSYLTISQFFYFFIFLLEFLRPDDGSDLELCDYLQIRARRKASERCIAGSFAAPVLQAEKHPVK